MENKLVSTIDKIVWIIYLALATATPLIFTTFNTELFEVPKMYFIYLAGAIIFFLTLTKFILAKKIIMPKNIVLGLFAVFVLTQIISTVFSIDRFTSIFGFPTRLNGGLFSQLAYLVIFAVALINLNFEKAKRLLFAMIITATIVSLWGIPAHFGKDPSCLVLTGELTSTCWKKEFDPTLRIFSTLGQPNWLASYLVLTLPISIAFLLQTKSKNLKFFFLLSSTFIFWALLLTTSRAGALGVAIALVILLLLLGTKNVKLKIRPLLTILAIFIILTLIFGTFLTSRIQEAISSNRSLVTNDQIQVNIKPTQTALDTGGTESAQIRLIVWRGAFEIFKNSPFLGSGPETFVSSYFTFRPPSHNQTTEWDFFYNKAHNEFLNYLATSGISGFFAYIAFIAAIFFKLLAISRNPNTNSTPRAHVSESRNSRQSSNNNGTTITKAAIASIIGYLVTIFFGFSIVATQITFFLILSSALSSKEQKFTEIKIGFFKDPFKPVVILITSIVGFFILIVIFRLYFANVLAKRAENIENTSLEQKITAYASAVKFNPSSNPYLLADYSTSMALATTALEDSGVAGFSDFADTLAQKALKISPNNFLIVQRISRTYILLAQIDNSFKKKAENVCQKLTTLAPTYPPAYLTCAKLQVVLEENNKSIEFAKKALALKPEYLEAQELLTQLTVDN